MKTGDISFEGFEANAFAIANKAATTFNHLVVKDDRMEFENNNIILEIFSSSIYKQYSFYLPNEESFDETIFNITMSSREHVIFENVEFFRPFWIDIRLDGKNGNREPYFMHIKFIKCLFTKTGPYTDKLSHFEDCIFEDQ